MAITERYVTVGAAGGGDGSSGNPWTLSEAIAAAAPGDRVNIFPGTYTRTANDAPAADGTLASPIIWRGCNVTIGDLDAVGRLNGRGPLISTNFPVIAYNPTFFWGGGNADYNIYQCLKFTGSDDQFVLVVGAFCAVTNCIMENSATDATASALAWSGKTGVCVDNSDVKLTGGSGGVAAVYLTATCVNATIYGCRISGPAAGIKTTGLANYGTVIAANIFVDVGGIAIDLSSMTNTVYNVRVLGNTIYSAGSAGIMSQNAALTTPNVFADNHITDCGGYAFDSAYKATAEIPGLFINNRTRDNTSGAIDGYGDYESALVNHVTADNGDATSDYVDAANGDLALKPEAVGRNRGTLNRDIGAVQHSDPARASYSIGI